MSKATRTLSDVLMALGTETDVNVDDVRAAILEYPEFASEIQAFAIEWYAMPDAGLPPVDEPAPVAVPFARNAAATEANPFAGKTPTELRALAAECEIPLSILQKFSSSLIDAATVPLLLVRRMAEILSISPGAILAHLDRRQTLATGADFRSSKPPEVGDKVSFADAVRDATMPDEQRAKWLELAR